MTLVLLARHATTPHVGHTLSGRSQDVGLSPDGLVQADRLASRVAGLGITRVVTSPLARARATAGAVAARLGLSVEVEPALTEIDFGTWEGKSFADLAHDPGWVRWNAERDIARPPGGERMADAQARAIAGVEQLVASAGPVLAVTHCDIIRAVVAHVLGLPLGLILRFEIDPASVTTLDISDGWSRAISINERLNP